MNNQYSGKISALVILSAGLIGFASGYLIEWLLAAHPCALCLYQRYAYLTAALIALGAYFFPTFQVVPLFAWMSLLVLTIFQYGVERQWWAYESTCTTPAMQELSFEKFMDKIIHAEAVPCDQPTLFFMHISLAGWSMLYTMLIMLVTLWYYHKSR